MGWGPEPPDDAEARANIARSATAWAHGTWAVFRIADVDSDEVIGGINLRFGEHDTAEISYFLRMSARRRGLAKRAVRLVAQWAFEELGIERIELPIPEPPPIRSETIPEYRRARRSIGGPSWCRRPS
jgi:RimJ/RimL family protein N-acetyltransferase